MAQAVQLNTTASTVLAGSNTAWETVKVQNLGPNPIYVDLDSTATVAGSFQVPASPSAIYEFRRPPRTAVSMIAATALQVSPADTRIERIEEAG